jgi:hypothetical protein
MTAMRCLEGCHLRHASLRSAVSGGRNGLAHRANSKDLPGAHGSFWTSNSLARCGAGKARGCKPARTRDAYRGVEAIASQFRLASLGTIGVIVFSSATAPATSLRRTAPMQNDKSRHKAMLVKPPGGLRGVGRCVDDSLALVAEPSHKAPVKLGKGRLPEALEQPTTFP